MTHIEQMIQDMCPNGVEFKTLGEVCEMKRGSTITANQAEDGDIPVIAGGQKPAYFHNQSNREGKNITVAGSGAYAGYVAYWEQPIFVSDAFTVTPKEAFLDIKFVYYFLTNIQDKIYHTKKGSGVPHVHPSSIADFEIPLPPLEIQKKIVECLDKFSALAAELQAELQMRRKQYEYYRTQLLTPHSDCNSADKTDDAQWEWKTLGEIFELRGGYTPSKNKPEFWEAGTIPWFRMEDIRENGRILKDAILHISPIAVKGQGLFEKDSFVLATSATIGEHALLAVDALTNQRFTNLKVRKQYKSVLYTKFIFYYMFKVDEFCKAHTNISGFESVDMDALRKMPFPIPPLSEQIRIADLLDKFEALTTSLSDGIPAEQAAQQKRYEYYRDLLLTFDRKAV